MNRDEIATLMNQSAGQAWGTEAHFQRFAALVAAREREACVRSLDDAAESAKLQSITDMLKKAAAIVRARGETK